MIRTLFPTKDTTIYERHPDQNTGLDQILELEKIVSVEGTSSDVSASRALVQFDLTDVSKSIANGDISGSSFKLHLDVTEADEIPLEYDVYANAVSGSWMMGIGKRFHTPRTTGGVTWNEKDGLNAWQSGGADYYSSPSASQSFDYSTPQNIDMDVTSIVDQWITSSRPNHGFLIRRNENVTSYEEAFYGVNTQTSDGTLAVENSVKYFSTDTHTIFPPRLMVQWDESQHNPTGSATEVSSFDNLVVNTKFEKPEYYRNEVVRFRLNVNPQVRSKTFFEDFTKEDGLYLPTSSYYKVKDEFTGLDIIPFDENYTKISTDTTGSYFDFEMSNLLPDRFYRFVYKIVINGQTKIIDDSENSFRLKVGN